MYDFLISGDENINVLSLFDGMSCGQIALNRANIKYDTYYASEINKNSIKITQKNYPHTIQLGNVIDLNEEILTGLKKPKLMIGGSPCQNLSRIVKNKSKHNQGLDGEKSKLFWEYVRVKDIVNPDYFLLENVESMSNEDKEIITETLEVEPIMIDSGLVSAQERKRYYWTNIPGVELPSDKGLVLRDIMENDVDKKYYYSNDFIFHGLDQRVAATLDLFNYDMLKRVYSPHFKSPTLTAVSGGHQQKKVFDNGLCRKLTPLEYERLQTVPEGYTKGVTDGHRYTMLGNGWTVDIIAHIVSYLK
ncbi:DNA cytosine methyltransferase [Paenibacillus xylanexedens]|uniref:DNA cytosine methyltransferase n=1 Tax=Paenibacillus xylanexedens TaxID=528191 RepID=UPI001C9317B5|nr:DNA cytosine methyltransferase [Paenibacillus xylanexedens]